LAEQGLISTPLGAVSSFDAAPDAIQAIADGEAIGKSVIQVARTSQSDGRCSAGHFR
jgi:hypothetical protein